MYVCVRVCKHIYQNVNSGLYLCVTNLLLLHCYIIWFLLAMNMYIKLLQKNQEKRPCSSFQRTGRSCDLGPQSNGQGSVFVSLSQSCLDEWHPLVLWVPSYLAFEKLKFRKMKASLCISPPYFLGTSLAILLPTISHWEPEVQSEDWEEREVPPGPEVTCRTEMLPSASSLFSGGPGTVFDTNNHKFSGMMKTQRSLLHDSLINRFNVTAG